MYPGYLKVVVDADMIVETIEFVYAIVGWANFNRSLAILVKAVLSITTVASEFNTSLLDANKQL